MLSKSLKAEMKKVTIVEPISSLDCVLPPDFSPFTRTLKGLKYRDFLNVLIKEKCPFHDKVKHELLPLKISREECSDSLKRIFEKFKVSPGVFTIAPNYTIFLVCTLLNVVITINKSAPIVKDTVDFFSTFIKVVLDTCDVNDVLNVMIPSLLFNVSNDAPPARQAFIILIAEPHMFGIKTILEKLLNFFDDLVQTQSMITRFHITLLTALLEHFKTIHNSALDRLKAFNVSLFNGPNNDLSRLLMNAIEQCEVISDSCSLTQTGYFDNNVNLQISHIGNLELMNNLTSSSEKLPLDQIPQVIKSSFNSLSSQSSFGSIPSIIAVDSSKNVEYLLGKIQENNASFPIKDHSNDENQLDDEILNLDNVGVLNYIRNYLDRVKAFPNGFKIEPLLDFAFEVYDDKHITKEDQKIIYLLMASLNSLSDPINLLKYYLQKNSSYKNKNFLEQCYQHFLKTSNIQKSEENSVPVSLTSTASNNESFNDSEIEFAFTCLNAWKSSYDGVRRVWEIIKSNPNVNFDEYFDPLVFTRKSFLIEGLKNCAISESEAAVDDLNFAKKLKAANRKIAYLEKRMLSETKSDRVSREALEITSKLNGILSESSSGSSPKMNAPPKSRSPQDKSSKKKRDRFLILKSRSNNHFAYSSRSSSQYTSSTMGTSASFDSSLNLNFPENKKNFNFSKKPEIYLSQKENQNNFKEPKSPLIKESVEDSLFDTNI